MEILFYFKQNQVVVALLNLSNPTVMNKSIISVILVTIYLIVYVTLFQLKGPSPIIAIMFLIAPFLVIGMVYMVLTDGYDYPELSEDEEWGYRDKPGYK
jgi:hypothetical protein